MHPTFPPTPVLARGVGLCSPEVQSAENCTFHLFTQIVHLFTRMVVVSCLAEFSFVYIIWCLSAVPPSERAIPCQSLICIYPAPFFSGSLSRGQGPTRAARIPVFGGSHGRPRFISSGTGKREFLKCGCWEGGHFQISTDRHHYGGGIAKLATFNCPVGLSKKLDGIVLLLDNYWAGHNRLRWIILVILKVAW